MSDPFSLIGRTPPTADPRQGPVAPPSFVDRVMGRGSYMKEFGKRRAALVTSSRKEKQRLNENLRRQRRKYELKLREDDRKLYQQFDIRPSMRGSKKGLPETERLAARKKSWLKIQKKMRLERRASERAVERRRDEAIKQMRDDLYSGMYNTAA